MKLPDSIAYTGRDLRRKGLRFITKRPVWRDLPFALPDCNGVDAEGRIWFTVRGNRMRINREYAWNGASPKRYWCGIFWGTPDFFATIEATLWHDIFFQFSYLLRHHVTMIQVNEMFYRDMQVRNFFFADLYHDAVAELGRNFWSIPDENLQLVLV